MLQQYQSINQSIYLHQTTWIHITIKENTRNDKIIKSNKKKRQEKNSSMTVLEQYNTICGLP